MERKEYSLTFVCYLGNNTIERQYKVYLNDEEYKEMQLGLNYLADDMIKNDYTNGMLSFYNEHNEKISVVLTKIVLIKTNIELNTKQSDIQNEYSY